MKLYYLPGSCALAPHIVAREAGLPVQAIEVEIGPAGRTVEDRDYYEINPLGVVPTLVIDDGDLLTEAAVIMQYLAAQAPGSHLGPPGDDRDRWRFLGRLNFVATELHKGFSPLFKPAVTGEARAFFLGALNARFDVVEQILEGQDHLAGPHFSIVDAYAFAVLRWSGRHQIDLSPWPAIVAYQARIAARPAVREAMEEQGLAG